MGVIHHSRYLLFFEEARTHFIEQIGGAKPGENFLEKINYPLIHCEVNYKKTLGFNEEMIIDCSVQALGARLIFDYRLTNKGFDKLVAFGKTVHVAFDVKKQKVIRLPDPVFDFLKKRSCLDGP